MILEELLWNVNDNTIVDIYSSDTNEIIASYDGKENIPEELNDFEVTDIFVEGNHLCIEISI